MNKVDWHFNRRGAGGYQVLCRREVSELLILLYHRGHEFAADFPEVGRVKVLRLMEAQLPKSNDSGNSETNVSAANTSSQSLSYSADVECCPKYLHILDLVKASLLYRQVEVVVDVTRSSVPNAMCIMKRNVMRQPASVFFQSAESS